MITQDFNLYTIEREVEGTEGHMEFITIMVNPDHSIDYTERCNVGRLEFDPKTDDFEKVSEEEGIQTEDVERLCKLKVGETYSTPIPILTESLECSITYVRIR